MTDGRLAPVSTRRRFTLIGDGATADGIIDAKVDETEAAVRDLPAPRDAHAALAPADRVKIIAEVKRASPSRGALAEIRLTLGVTVDA